MTINIPGMPDPGPFRYFIGKHQPHKKLTPLRVELRERTNKHTDKIIPSFSRLIGYEDTIAADDSIIEAADKILTRAAGVDNYDGILIADHTVIERES